MELRDGLVGLGSSGTALVRLVRALDRPVLVEHHLRLGGFPAGDEAPWRLLDAEGECLGSREALTVTCVHADGQWRGLAVLVGHDESITIDELVTALDEAEAAFEAEIARARLPKRHPDRAEDALAVLRACTYEPTGAVVAAVTTSLPEVPGGDRQWDYRYCWLRDAGLAVSVAALLGDGAAAGRYLEFVRSTAGHGVPEAPLVTIEGGRVPVERIVEVEGWAGSRPVRVGNDAAGQVQHDALGLIVEAVSVYLQTGGSLDDDTWALVCRIADAAAGAPDDEPSSGIWELRDERPLVSADIGRWLALDRAIWIARGWHPLYRRAKWKRARHRLRERVLGELGNDGRLPQAYGGTPRSDASALMVPLFGMLRRDDARAHAMVDAVTADLGAGPFLYRYEPDGDDGLAPGEGTFLPVAWWAVSTLAVLGRVDEARSRLDELCLRLPRLMPEEV
ncbi:MAG: glycoside hydrolase family 15 protein, partial [Actinomycetota bacterium]|nr:glycoside hydrolase family 15 protein [Actinomycetota bacterium]